MEWVGDEYQVKHVVKKPKWTQGYVLKEKMRLQTSLET